MEEKLNETNVEAARVTPDRGFQLIKVNNPLFYSSIRIIVSIFNNIMFVQGAELEEIIKELA
jgi:hypothetical protein